MTELNVAEDRLAHMHAWRVVLFVCAAALFSIQDRTAFLFAITCLCVGVLFHVIFVPIARSNRDEAYARYVGSLSRNLPEETS